MSVTITQLGNSAKRLIANQRARCLETSCSSVGLWLDCRLLTVWLMVQ